MKPHENTTAYDGWENLAHLHRKPSSVTCHAKLDGCRPEVELIRNYCLAPGGPGRVCELGSGNSKLLYALERDGVLREGIGLEISSTRHEFAQAFQRLIGSTKVQNFNANVFEMDPLKECDLICAMDIVLQMMTPVNEDAEQRLFSWIKSSLKPGGRLLAELRDFQNLMDIIHRSEGKVHRFWEEFPESDPWRYCLNRLTFLTHTSEADVRWEKTFLKRDSMETSQSQCVWRPYSVATFSELLARHGLKLLNVISKAPGLFTAIALKP